MNDTRDNLSLSGEAAATFWDEFATLLADPVSFSALWEHDSYEVRRLWAALEECSAYRIEHVYAAWRRPAHTATPGACSRPWATPRPPPSKRRWG